MTTQEKAKQLGNQPVNAEIFFKQNGEASEDCPFEATTYPGMTLRQYYAGLAMQALIESDSVKNVYNSCGGGFSCDKHTMTAELAVKYADALLLELSKTNEP